MFNYHGIIGILFWVFVTIFKDELKYILLVTAQKDTGNMKKKHIGKPRIHFLVL